MKKIILSTILMGCLSGVFAQAIGNSVHNSANYKEHTIEKSSSVEVSLNDNSVSRKAQQLIVADPGSNSVVLEADVMINVRANSYVAIFTSTQTGLTIEGTDSAMNKRLDKFFNRLKSMGLSDKNLHVDFISLVPAYEVEMVNRVFSNAANELEKGFIMKKNVHVIFKEHRLLDQIISAAAAASIYDLVKVDYNIDNIHAAYDSLRIIAEQIIEKKRKVFNGMGLETTINNLSEGYNCVYPLERYSAYTAYHTGNSKQDAIKDNPRVDIKETEKLQSVYYNKVPYNQFDMVINASEVEPAVQFYYKLKVRYSVAPKKVEVKPITRS